MVSFLRKKSRDQRGQTAVEYLMLLAVAFITAYIMVTGPLASFTVNLLNNLRSGIRNTVQHGEWSNEQIDFGNPRHPTSPERLRPLHL